MPDTATAAPPAPTRGRVTTTRELALRLLAGQVLSRGLDGWRVGDDLVPVDPAVFAQLRTGFRLVPGGDALPGFEASFSQTMLLEPLYDVAGVRQLLNKSVERDGGVTAFARKRHLSKGQVGDAVAQRRDTIAPNISAGLGLIERTFYVQLRPGSVA